MFVLVVVLLIFATSSAAQAQATVYDSYIAAEPWTEPQEIPTPPEVHALELQTGIPPCGGEYTGRSRLDGALASCARDAELHCRSVWDSTVRFELGLLGGGNVDRSDGGVGGLSLSLGLRFEELFSVYYLLILSGGYWQPDTETSFRVAAWSAFMFELSPLPWLGVALGPSIDYQGGCTLADVQSDSSCFLEPSYGVHGRLTLEVAELPFGGLTITGDAHLDLREEPETTFLLGVGLRF